jgi:hypothetical protein
MGKNFVPEKHTAEFDTATITCICTVRNAQEAREKVLELKDNGFGAIELCGAFSRDFALELIALTNGETAIGYSVHEPEQDGLFERFFGGK